MPIQSLELISSKCHVQPHIGELFLDAVRTQAIIQVFEVDKIEVLVLVGAGEKIGADGVWVCCVPPNKQWTVELAMALKVEYRDDKRAWLVIAVEILSRLGVLGAEDLAVVSPLSIYKRPGDAVCLNLELASAERVYKKRYLR